MGHVTVLEGQGWEDTGLGPREQPCLWSKFLAENSFGGTLTHFLVPHILRNKKRNNKTV